MSYKTINVGEMCVKVISGGTPLTSKSEFYSGGTIPWLKTKEVNFSRIYSTEYFISEKGLVNSSAQLIPENSVIVAMYGQGDTAGRVAINKIPLSTNQACCNLIINEEKADYRFVYYALKNSYKKLVSMKNGGAQPNLNTSLIKGLEIPNPEINIQRRIADTLSVYDDLIENNQKQIKLLEEAAMRLYQEWFVKLRFPGHEATKIVDGVPEGWEKGKTKKFYEFKYGKALKADARTGKGYPVYGSSGIVGYHSEFLVEGPCIIIGRKGNVGSVYISYENIYPIDTVYYILTEISLYYAYYELMNRTFVDSDSAIPGLNRSYAESMDMLCPENSVQKMFDKIVSELFSLRYKSLCKVELLRQARDKLLPKLMNGEIEV